jgi:peptidoglycan/LPS O-acetylase OafA/YrhL
MAWLGLVSYGIFLWHNAVVIRLSHDHAWGFAPLLLATVAVTVPIAAASYYLLERPVLRWKR